MKITTPIHIVQKVGMRGTTSAHLMCFRKVDRYKFTLDVKKNFQAFLNY